MNVAFGPHKNAPRLAKGVHPRARSAEWDRQFQEYLDSGADMASMISAAVELGDLDKMNAALPTPRELVASWGSRERKSWVA